MSALARRNSAENLQAFESALPQPLSYCFGQTASWRVKSFDRRAQVILVRNTIARSKTRATPRPQKIATVAERSQWNPEEVKGLKHLVGEVLPNNPLTLINKKSCVLDAGKCDSDHIGGGGQQQRQLNQIGRG
jgi:hypothetical protein